MKNIKQDIITVDSGKPGKVVTIMAGVHGNEVCGPQALADLLPKIKIISGKVYFIYANLKAIAQNVRQVEMNLNRAFRPENEITAAEKQTYEFQRAQELKPYLDESDALLDVHSSHNPKSTPFIICESHSFSIAEKLPFSIRSHGWDVVEAGGTDYYMNKQNKPGICIECGYNLDPQAISKAKESIITFLSLMGNIESKGDQQKYPQQQIYAYDIYHTKTNQFKLARKFADFELLPANTLIGHDGQEEIKSKEQNIIIFAHDRDQVGKEAFVLGKSIGDNSN